MKKLILVAASLGIYFVSLVYKDKQNQIKKQLEIPTTYKIWDKDGVPAKTTTVRVGDLIDSVLITGQFKNGKVYSFVSPKVVSRLKEGAEASLQYLDKKFIGKVAGISRTPSLLSGLHEVVLQFDSRELEGKNVIVSVEVSKLTNALVVERDAVTNRDGTYKVYLINDNQLQIRPVEVVARNSHSFALKGKIKAGDEVVISDQRYLNDGDKINIVK